jgi:hypothetical protein
LNRTFTGSTTNGTANTHCRNEAADAGLPNPTTFVALRARSDAGASTLVRLDAGDWYRVDGWRLIGSGELGFDGPVGIEIPLVLDAKGNYTPRSVWTGGRRDGGPALTAVESCSDWTQSTTGFRGGTGNSEFLGAYFWNEDGGLCNTSRSVYCFEN